MLSLLMGRDASLPLPISLSLSLSVAGVDLATQYNAYVTVFVCSCEIYLHYLNATLVARKGLKVDLEMKY